ncbi:unnamed protein product [Urochloa humidicola]
MGAIWSKYFVKHVEGGCIGHTVIKREKKLFCSTMALGGFVDWRGSLINKEVHGGVRAAWFMYFLTFVTSMVNVPILLNLVIYLRGTMHMGVSGSATTVTNLVGATSGFALGYGLLALQAYIPSLHPPPCNIEVELSKCKEVHGWNATLFYAALYISAFGEGCMRACLPSLGADQFDHEDPSESRQQSSFFNWFLWLHSETGGLNCLRSWKKYGKAMLNKALLKYSPKQTTQISSNSSTKLALTVGKMVPGHVAAR